MIRNLLSQLANLIRRTTSTGGWIAEIDGLRFVAIVPVVLQHLLERFGRATSLSHSEPLLDDPTAFFISRGIVGVFLFFAISGFVVAMPFAKQYLNGADKISLKRFYGRRLTRIEPPYLIWMTVFALVLIAQGSWSLQAILPHWAASMTYTHSLFYEKYPVINPVAWSLEIEIQFYLLAPVLAGLYFRISNTNWRRIGMACFLLLLTAVQYSAGWWFIPGKMTLLGQLQNFLVGFLLLDFYLTSWKAASKGSYAWDLVAVLAFVTMCYTWTTEWLKTIVFLSALGLLFAASFKSILFRNALRNRWIALTGGMCYTIYLIHLPMLQALVPFTAALHFPGGFWANFCCQTAILVPFIWAASVGAYLLLERPFMQTNPFKSIKPNWLTMKKYASIPMLLLLTICTLSTAAAQETRPVQTTRTVDSLQLKPLETIINMTINRSPEIKANQIDAAKQSAAVKIQRRSWMDMVAVGGSMLYGNGTVLDNNQDALGSKYLLTDRKSVGTNVSVSIRLSGGDLANRRQKTTIQQLQLERIQLEKEGIEQQLRLEIISEYNQLELAVQMVHAKAEALENLQIASGIVEKYFREGTLSVGEYTTMLSKISTARDQFIQVQAETKRLAQMLRERCGGDIWMH